MKHGKKTSLWAIHHKTYYIKTVKHKHKLTQKFLFVLQVEGLEDFPKQLDGFMIAIVISFIRSVL